MADAPRLPRIKVCGVTVLADVEGAFAHGVDAIGIVRWPRSPRYLDDDAAAKLVASLPSGIFAVEVLVDAEPYDVSPWAKVVQLCGGEAPEPWFDFHLPILRRLPVAPGSEIVLEAWAGVAAGFVLDHPSAPGGTGKEVDLELAADLARRATCLLAGGLDDTNVGERVRRVRSAGVDASSRLETAPGRKDPTRVAAYARAAKSALEDAR